MISFYVFQITDDEKLPKQFCYDCIIKIESCHTFIKEALNVNITLKNMLLRCDKSVIHTPEIIRTVEEPNKLRLTLPDYKLSIGINIDDHVYEDNVDTNCKENYNIKTNMLPLETVENSSTGKESVIENAKRDTNKNICIICQKSFISKKWFEKHMEKEHSGQKYVCKYCSKCMYVNT